MSRKMISCIFLLFIIIVSLLFSHFIFKHSIEAFGHDKPDEKEDALLNPEKASGSGPAPAPAGDTKTIQSGYGILTEGFDTKKPSSQGIYDYLFDKNQSTNFSLPKL